MSKHKLYDFSYAIYRNFNHLLLTRIAVRSSRIICDIRTARVIRRSGRQCNASESTRGGRATARLPKDVGTDVVRCVVFVYNTYL